jgi:phage tail-like protein
MPGQWGWTSQSSSLSNIDVDPLRNFKFRVIISQQGAKNSGNYNGGNLGFMSVSGLSISAESTAYRQGGMNTTVQQMPLQATYSDVTLSRGLVLGDSYIYTWMTRVFQVMQGVGGNSKGTDFRATVDIYLLDHPITSINSPYKAGWRLYNCWPKALNFSDLNAGGNGIAISQVVLAHEGWDFKIADKTGPDSIALFS